MSTTIIYCRFEPGNFPYKEFMKDANGSVIFPFIHKATHPYHYTNGAFFYSLSPEEDTDSEGVDTNTGGERLPIIPLPPTYIPITPQMMPDIYPELNKFIRANPKASIEEYIEFGESLKLAKKEFNLAEMIKINHLDIVLHDPIDRDSNRKTLKNLYWKDLENRDIRGFNNKYLKGLDKKDRGGFGGPHGMGGMGGLGGF